MKVRWYVLNRLYGKIHFDDESCRQDLVQYSADEYDWAFATTDGRVKFGIRKGEIVAEVHSPRDFPVIYPVRHTTVHYPLKAVLMDLDGTTIVSEEFWIDAIQETVRLLLRDTTFTFSSEDIPYVSGYSTREHLQYCIKKYDIQTTIYQALELYETVAKQWLKQIEQNPTSPLLKPSPGLKEFLLTVKEQGIKIGLVTSATEHKALMEIRSVFSQLNLGDPLEFYDTIVTAGNGGRKGRAGTMGSLPSKPHPWLYMEAARIGLGLSDEERHHIIGIEDSAAGVIALKLAGFAAIGMKKGNIKASGVRPLLHGECTFLPELIPILLGAKELNR